MDWKDWAPLYDRIRSDFGYPLEADERAAERLDELLAEGSKPLPDIASVLKGEDVVIVGGATFDAANIPPDSTIVAADGATDAVLAAGGIPDVIVTDLDGRVDLQAQCNTGGAALVVHAHGDNVAALETYVPDFAGKVLGTCQSKPVGRIVNYGGFTDGDRACLLAEHFGAARLLLVGFDFENPSPKPGRSAETKARKLAWARTIIGNVRIPVTYL
ncbi:MAG: DUF115 domain-containing protein [Euryarchaeota archaeon]|nr:DUF115 domain-containing protein [Euryarchaeota archaeon]